ncbi:related to transposase [Ustilago trichophora]|uniref:Related to transposase n=1 Tax=Ustilago trichophora TaxID=86804 RepID=A0A5C3E729_9BASI|nr:related to transposase [Ustilago trichophora]
MKPISPQKRHEALKLLENGLSTRQIAHQVGMSKSMVSKIRNLTIKELPIPKSGRKNKLNHLQMSWINRFVKRNPRTTLCRACQEVLQQLKVKLAPSTLCKALLFNHFRARKIVKKPLLNNKHKKDCLAFALAHRELTIDDWKTVIWSDEAKINRLGSDGKQHCWINTAGFSSKLVHPTLKFGGGNIMVWGAMTHKGVGSVHVVRQRMTAGIYIDILEENLLRLLRTIGFFNDVTRPIFQQDNDPKHKAKIAMQWFQDNHIRLLDWPAQSLDLKPIEHLWTKLKRRLGQYNTRPSGVLELECRVQEVWAQIPVSTCHALIESMPRRIEAVIKAKGGHTKY